MRDPVVDKIVAHVERVGEHGVPEAARVAAKTFIADTLAVGIAGCKTPWRGEILDTLAGVGGPEEATVLGGGEKLPLMHAAMLNAYQIHAQEFDCVHEGAVVHPMAASLPVLLGWAEREGGVSGARLIRAVVVAVDVAATLGLCSRAPMRFFRPANAGGLGATVGLAMLAGLDGAQLRDAIGIYYGQCAGTMQAHSEGTPQLAMQMGFAARSAVTAVELARRGMPGPHAPISGEFGYFALFDGKADPAPFDQLGERWRITELSHKPFPSGRATHGGIDGLQRLMTEDGVSGDRVVACRFRVPPLTARLVGRPAVEGMTARLRPAVSAICRGCLPAPRQCRARRFHRGGARRSGHVEVGPPADRHRGRQPGPQRALAAARRNRSRRRPNRRRGDNLGARQPRAAIVARSRARQVHELLAIRGRASAGAGCRAVGCGVRARNLDDVRPLAGLSAPRGAS